MLTSALHDPYAAITQSQYTAALARRKRLAKIAAGARPDTPIMLRTHPPIVVELAPPETPPVVADPEQEWVERQKQIPSPISAQPRRLSVVDIQRAAAEHFGFNWKVMFCANRTAPIVRARHTAMYLTKKLTPFSLPQIGRRFGGRDHTTVLHAVRKIEHLISHDAFFAAEVDSIKTAIAARLA